MHVWDVWDVWVGRKKRSPQTHRPLVEQEGGPEEPASIFKFKIAFFVQIRTRLYTYVLKSCSDVEQTFRFQLVENGLYRVFGSKMTGIHVAVHALDAAHVVRSQQRTLANNIIYINIYIIYCIYIYI